MSKYTPEYIERRNAAIREAQARYAPHVADFSYDHGLPTAPAGHSSGFETAVFITSNYRRDYRPDSMNVTPQQVIDALVAGGVKDWVLMGLYGYVGYLAEPRATQDVDVLISFEEETEAVGAITERWPKLQKKRYEVVVRFFDPGEVGVDGQIKHVLDLMLPSNRCHEAILKNFHEIDPATGHHIPILEAAVASKYAALVSPNRDWTKRAYDAGDMRSIMVCNTDRIDHDLLHTLGELVFEGGGRELLEFLQLAIDNKPFPV